MVWALLVDVIDAVSLVESGATEAAALGRCSRGFAWFRGRRGLSLRRARRFIAL